MTINGVKYEEVYKVGDAFCNSNGDSYTVIAINPEEDKMLLCKKSKSSVKSLDGQPLYVGATGIGNDHWAYGHYFMSDLTKAVKWFNERKEDKHYNNYYVVCSYTFDGDCPVWGPFATFEDAWEYIKKQALEEERVDTEESEYHTELFLGDSIGYASLICYYEDTKEDYELYHSGETPDTTMWNIVTPDYPEHI